MNVNEPNRSASNSSAATARARTERCAAHRIGILAELVRNLCALAADSPERQAKIQSLMHAYATGKLHVDAEATASAMIDDAFGSRRTLLLDSESRAQYFSAVIDDGRDAGEARVIRIAKAQID